MNFSRSKLSLALATAVFTALAHLPGQTSDAATESRALAEQWLTATNLISRERSDWKVEEAALVATREVLAAELEGLAETLESLRGATTAADEEKFALAEERGSLTALQGVVGQRITQMERRVEALAQRFPAPLMTSLQPLLTRIPDTEAAAANVSLGLRLGNILAILQQAERFNGTLRYQRENRQIGNSELQVDVLYWGLGGAYFASLDGSVAGVGTPGANGWQWTPVPGSAPAMSRLMAVYNGSGDPAFVSLPVTIR